MLFAVSGKEACKTDLLAVQLVVSRYELTPLRGFMVHAAVQVVTNVQEMLKDTLLDRSFTDILNYYNTFFSTLLPQPASPRQFVSSVGHCLTNH